MAIIRIKNLRLRCIIGANDWERDHKQNVIINVVFYFDATKSSMSDNLKETVDYKVITKKIISITEDSSFYLIERLAKVILDIVCEHPLVEKANVIIDKPAALRFSDSVSVELSC